MTKSHHQKSFKILIADAFQNSFEIVCAIVIYYLYGGVSWIGWGLDSVGELTTTLVLVFYVIQKINGSNDDHDHAEHVRERKASVLVAYSFFGLAVFTFMWAISVGEEPSPEKIIWWPKVMVGISIATTLILAWLKSRQVTADHDPMRGGALQSWICILSGVIGAVADYLHHWFQASHFIGAMVITALLIFGGYKTYVRKRLCEH